MTGAGLDRLAKHAAAFTGFSREAILDAALRKAAEQLERSFGTEEEVLSRASRRDREVIEALCQAVSVGETFFFRQPEHFRWIAGRLALLWAQEGRSEIHAWSAGCATGEETYSLAACLLDLAPPGAQVSVLGTDLLERNLAAARDGTYGSWSRRVSGPMLHRVFADDTAERASVLQHVRNVTLFQRHNLLDPPPGIFDVVFCRNVLVYFSPEAARTALRNLTQAVAPKGALFFGSMDVTQGVPGLHLARPTELQIYGHEAPELLTTPKAVPKLAVPPPVKPPKPLPFDPIALHVRALEQIESGELKRALADLEELSRKAPDYLPALLERALLLKRGGERTAAAQLMREVLRRAEALLPDQVVQGPEPLLASFYRESAVAYLRGTGGAA
ncbi:MAG TPA: CheR family methyltransferase [Myxococcales bacterium]|jgi:chemotaxis methyl-accepting protein methylase